MDDILSKALRSTIQESNPEIIELYDKWKPICQSIQIIAQVFYKMIQEIVETQEFQQFINGLKNIQTYYKAEDKYWIIDDEILLKILGNVPSEEYSNQITEYYTKNNYINIEKLLNKWREITYITDRMAIFEDCYKAMQVITDRKIINNIVIPTLTAQISGLTEDLHKLVPNDIRSTIKQELTKNGKTPSEGEITIEYLWRQEQKREVFDCYTVIFKAVMKNTQKIETYTKDDLEKYNKYRNKILHGDKQFLNYGTDENLIRSWLELHTLIKVYSIYNDYKTKGFDNE